ncbi:MAG: hypothetical protein KC535_03355 [Nanoarchaeota archaeon]|nr:hypothetical protein [Nanoarchaeota archaeon]
MYQTIHHNSKFYAPQIIKNFSSILKDLKKEEGMDTYLSIVALARRNNQAFIDFYQGIKVNKIGLRDVKTVLWEEHPHLVEKHCSIDNIIYEVIPTQFVEDDRRNNIIKKLEKTNRKYQAILDANETFKEMNVASVAHGPL